jgi:hypothetical protein
MEGIFTARLTGQRPGQAVIATDTEGTESPDTATRQQGNTTT